MARHSSPEELKRKAQAHFEKAAQQKIEAEKALSEYKAKKDAAMAKTIRLRALRLAKEADDAAAALAKAERRVQRNASGRLSTEKIRK